MCFAQKAYVLSVEPQTTPVNNSAKIELPYQAKKFRYKNSTTPKGNGPTTAKVLVVHSNRLIRTHGLGVAVAAAVAVGVGVES